MFDLKQALNNISAKWKYKLDEISPNVYRMDVAIKIGDDKWRYQFVYIWESEKRYFGQPVVYMNSRCGMVSPSINFYTILKEAGYCNLSNLTVTTDKTADGKDCETIICQAGLPLEFINEVMLDKTIYEVANNADIIEEKYFGGDGN